MKNVKGWIFLGIVGLCAYYIVQKPNMIAPISHLASGVLPLIVVGAIVALLAKEQDRVTRFFMIGVAILLFVGFGGMDWFTYGEFQGLPWDTFDGSRWRYESGSGWTR